jgi:hypothetical protein
MHATWHAGRAHYIVKVDRGTANAQSGGMTPGWHLWDDNPDDDENRWDGFGPGLGRTVELAKRRAEAWIICPHHDMMGYPKLSLALDGAADWGNHLLIRADDDRRRFTVDHRRDGTRHAELVPLFLGTGGATSLRWRAFAPDGETLLASGSTWATALTELGEHLASQAASR